MRERVTVVGSVCLSGENKLLRSLTPIIGSAYSIHNMTNARFNFTKNVRVENMTRETNLIAPPDSENEQVSCCCQETYRL